jgi:hypothetical protein
VSIQPQNKAKLNSLSGRAVEIAVKSRAERNIEQQIERKTSQNFKSFGGDAGASGASGSSLDLLSGMVGVGVMRASECFS